jgi:type IV pilus assembly protein PilC
LLDVSDFVQAYGPQILIGLLALTAAFTAVYLWPPGRLVVDRIALRTPLLGFLLRLSATVQFSHGLALLLRSGITLVEALRTVEVLHRNRWAAGRVAEARAAVLRGGSLAEPLATPGVFMPMLARMTAVGESAGTLDEVLTEVARFHENQLQGTIKLFSTIIEPVVIVVVGGIVGFVYIAFFVAMFAAAGGAK